MSAGVSRIGHKCLWKWVELVKIINWSCWVYSGMSKGVGRIGQAYLREWLGLVKSFFGSEQYWSKVGRSRV